MAAAQILGSTNRKGVSQPDVAPKPAVRGYAISDFSLTLIPFPSNTTVHASLDKFDTAIQICLLSIHSIEHPDILC